MGRPHPHPTTDISACFLTVKYAVARLEPVKRNTKEGALIHEATFDGGRVFDGGCENADVPWTSPGHAPPGPKASFNTRKVDSRPQCHFLDLLSFAAISLLPAALSFHVFGKKRSVSSATWWPLWLLFLAAL